MEFAGEYTINATRERVWDALNDPEILKQAIPGCQEIEKQSPTEMTATIKSKIGPVQATFKGAVTLSNLNPPEGYTIAGEGKGGVAGFAKGSADVTLSDADGGGTLLRYQATGQVGGKIAQVGARLVEGTGKKLADEFFGAFDDLLATDEAPATEEPDETETPEPAAVPDVLSHVDDRSSSPTTVRWLVAAMLGAAVALIAIWLLE
ncbi:MAG: carbon monoxide dehydrogenase subunit G [Pseudomonadota bacterium]